MEFSHYGRQHHSGLPNQEYLDSFPTSSIHWMDSLGKHTQTFKTQVSVYEK